MPAPRFAACSRRDGRLQAFPATNVPAVNLALPISTLLALALAACAGERDAAGTDAGAIDIAPDDQPYEDVPPATAPAGTAMPAAAPGPIPAEGAIGYAGFGPARFGADREAVRIAWGKDIKADTPSEPGGCHYLVTQTGPQPRPATGYGLGFMIEGDRFARIDVDSADIAAPGGGRVGMGAGEIRARYAGGIEEQPHKYVDGGKYLRISDPAGGSGVLVFATDAAGTVTQWRIGVPPQVDYVEGCS